MNIEKKGLIKDPVILKGLTMLVLVGLLLIPLALISEVVSERSNRKKEAENSLISNFGGEVIINSPMIVVPYIKTETTSQLKKDVRTEAYFMPETVNFNGEIIPEKRYRGIYEFMLYSGNIKFSGEFKNLDFSTINEEIKEILWDEAYLELEISDMKGFREKPIIKINGEDLLMRNEVTRTGLFGGGLKGLIRTNEDSYKFTGSLKIQGGRSIRFIPTATETSVKLTSSWESPSFIGAYLPRESTLEEKKGFNANWYILSYTSSFSPVMSRTELENIYIDESVFGVNLKVPVDIYHMTERSLKYGVLFLILPFITFFLFELFSDIKVHPFHYMFVGITASLFFLLLIAISEHFSFKTGYITGVIFVSSLITYYACYFLKSVKRGILLLPILLVSYALMYIMINSEDYALLMGTIGIFTIVAGIMIGTRNINWYEIDKK